MFELRKQPLGIPVEGDGYRTHSSDPYLRRGGAGLTDDDPEQGRVDFFKLLSCIVHYRWLITSFLVASLVTGVMITLLQTPLYRSVAQIEILTPGAKVFQDLEIVSQSSDFRAFETARLKMLSRELARRVAFELNLVADEKFLAPTPTFSLMNLVYRATGASRQANLDDLNAIEREKLAVDILQDNLSVTLTRNTSVLEIAFSHASAPHAALVANQFTRSFIDQNVDKTSETSDLARQFIQKQVREARTKLQASEKALVSYARKHSIALTGDDASLIAENISRLNGALAQAIQDRLTAERYRDQVEDGNASTLPEVFESDSIQETKQKITELKASFQEKLATLKPGFPQMRRIKAQIEELNRQIQLEVDSIAQTILIRYEQAKEWEKGIKLELAELEVQQREFQDKNIQYTMLKGEVDSDRAQYDNLTRKLNEVGIGAELRNANVSIVDPAVEAVAPYSPNLLRNGLLSVALFAATVAFIIYLLELMNRSFSVPDQIESELKLPVLGTIPLVANAELMDAVSQNDSPISEAYRSLRTSIQFTGIEGTARTLLATSTEPEEGKTVTVYKLAQDFSALGRNVLAIDADMRRPSLHHLFETDNSVGLANLLSGVVPRNEVDTIFKATKDPNITFMPAGTIPPNPVDLLMSERMELILRMCVRQYDLVLIDSPPVLDLSDAPILSRLSDVTLLVVASKQPTRNAAKVALARLRRTGGNVVGAAFTKFTHDRFDYNYAYRYRRHGRYSASNHLEDHASPQQEEWARKGKLSAFADGLFDRFVRGSS